jgi:dipeptidyl aminopeptidase/acylaminoacyl peptidase
MVRFARLIHRRGRDLGGPTDRADGTFLRNLTPNSEGDDAAASWSPDGRKILFNRGFGDPELPIWDLFTMDADGSNQRDLTRTPEFVEWESNWSPDGRRIVFSSDRDGDLEIYRMRPDGSRQVNLTRHPAFDLGPEWQPLPKHHLVRDYLEQRWTHSPLRARSRPARREAGHLLALMATPRPHGLPESHVGLASWRGRRPGASRPRVPGRARPRRPAVPAGRRRYRPERSGRPPC